MKKECSVIAKNGGKCSKPRLKWSRYCWHHQDIIGSLTYISIILAVIIPFIIFFLQEIHPLLNAKCNVIENGNPCAMECIVSNSGRGEAKNILLSFNNMLPLQTKVFASPELGVTIIESDFLPNPQLSPELAKIQKAFAVQIPRVVKKYPVKFQVKTGHLDNQRAGKQILRIRKEIINVLKAFGERLAKDHPEEAKNWDVASIINARIKEENFFSPAKLSYEKGIIDIEYFTEKEKIARAINQDLYAKFKKEFIDIFQGKPEFIA